MTGASKQTDAFDLMEPYLPENRGKGDNTAFMPTHMVPRYQMKEITAKGKSTFDLVWCIFQRGSEPIDPLFESAIAKRTQDILEVPLLVS